MVDLHDRTKQLYWDTLSAEQAREIVSEKMKRVGCTERQACRLIGDAIEINHKYLYQISGGYVKTGNITNGKIQRYWVKYKNRPAYKKRLVISFDDNEKHIWEMCKELTNEERKDGLIEKARQLGK